MCMLWNKRIQKQEQVNSKEKFDFFHVNRSDILKLTKENCQDYKEKLKIESLLPVNDEGYCKKCVSWKTKSVLQ